MLAPAPAPAPGPGPGPSPAGPPFLQYGAPLRRARTLSPTARRRRRNRRRPRAVPWMRGRWSKRQGSRRVQRARRRSPQCLRSRPPGPHPRPHRRPPRKTKRRPCPYWAVRWSARSEASRAWTWRLMTTTRRAGGALHDPGPGRAGPAWPRLQAESNKVLPILPLPLLSMCGAVPVGVCRHLAAGLCVPAGGAWEGWVAPAHWRGGEAIRLRAARHRGPDQNSQSAVNTDPQQPEGQLGW